MKGTPRPGNTQPTPNDTTAITAALGMYNQIGNMEFLPEVGRSQTNADSRIFYRFRG